MKGRVGISCELILNVHDHDQKKVLPQINPDENQSNISAASLLIEKVNLTI